MQKAFDSAYSYLCVSRGYVAIKVFYQEADQITSIRQILTAPSDRVTTEGDRVALIERDPCHIAISVEVHPAPAYGEGIPSFRGDFGGGARSGAADITIDLKEVLTFKDQLALRFRRRCKV